MAQSIFFCNGSAIPAGCTEKIRQQILLNPIRCFIKKQKYRI